MALLLVLHNFYISQDYPVCNFTNRRSHHEIWKNNSWTCRGLDSDGWRICSGVFYLADSNSKCPSSAIYSADIHPTRAISTYEGSSRTSSINGSSTTRTDLALQRGEPADPAGRIVLRLHRAGQQPQQQQLQRLQPSHGNARAHRHSLRQPAARADGHSTLQCRMPMTPEPINPAGCGVAVPAQSSASPGSRSGNSTLV